MGSEKVEILKTVQWIEETTKFKNFTLIFIIVMDKTFSKTLLMGSIILSTFHESFHVEPCTFSQLFGIVTIVDK